jgi:acetolactate synthase-1/2/3 large subunit
LGLCLADRTKTVIASIGDGVFYLSPILPTLLLSARLGIPFIMLVLNNGGMNSIAKSVRDLYPNCSGKLPLTSFDGQVVDFEKCAAMVSGLGLRATTPRELCRALSEGIEFCREQRRPVIINAIFSEADIS